MPLANVRGAAINYESLGTAGPWVALSPGGREEWARKEAELAAIFVDFLGCAHTVKR